MIEFWKSIPGYEGIYEVSDLGRVKSLGNNESRKEKILKPGLAGGGYYIVTLHKNGNGKTKLIHQLVAICFLNHIPCKHKKVVDHKNSNRIDNRLDNLQIITQRENVYKAQGNYSSQYKGVYWAKRICKWQSGIRINGKSKHLGYFIDEYDAHLAYQKALEEIKKGD